MVQKRVGMELSTDEARFYRIALGKCGDGGRSR